MSWFESLVGFKEENASQIRANLEIDNEIMTSLKNGRKMRVGKLEMPRLSELRDRVGLLPQPICQRLKVSEVVADVQHLHMDQDNSNALFQVASQFNLLEMVSPSITPEDGVTGYEFDQTQGPACAIACGAGTIYRNYFAPVNGQIGQSASNQIDCLRDLGAELGNFRNQLWETRNGYALATAEGLEIISQKLSSLDDLEKDTLRGFLRIGIQFDTEVTLGCERERHSVTQAYCSALPVAYSYHATANWAPFAQFVLEASYEATLCAGVLNAARNGNHQVYLTLLGGGAFGNHDDWILNAIRRALQKLSAFDLDVMIVSYGSSKTQVQQLIKGYGSGNE